jgi:bifunctional ADP-heptose synthase (sugar kinase/adenylyltransferase)
MMKTTLTGCFLRMTMLAGLLMAPFAIAQNEDQPEVLMQAVQQRQLVEGSDQVAEARTLFAAPAQPAGLSGRYAMISLVSEAYGSVRVLETLQAIDFQNVSRVTVPEERPTWWCRLIFCKRGW